MTKCQACGGRAQLFLCRNCTDELRELFTALPWWLNRLAEEAVGQVRKSDGARGSSHRQPFKGDDQALTRCQCGHGEHEFVACRAVDVEQIEAIIGLDDEGKEITVTVRNETICHCDDYAPAISQAKLRSQLLAAGRVNARASERIDQVRNSLTTWVRHLGEVRGIVFVRVGFIGPLPVGHVRLSATTRALTAFLTEHVLAIAADQSAGECLADFRAHVGAIEKLINRPVAMEWLTCLAWNERERRECGAEIRCREGTVEVTCRACRTVHNVNRLKMRMWNEAEHKELTVDEILKLNRCAPEDRQIPPRTLRRWRREGPNGEPPKLKPCGYRRPSGRRVINRHGDDDEPLYRWSDVRKLRAEKAKVEAK